MMKFKTKITIAIILLIMGICRISAMFIVPTALPAVQFSYSEIIQNPVFHFLFCWSLIAMLVGIKYVRVFIVQKKLSSLKDNYFIFTLIVGVISVACFILLKNWTYIQSNLIAFTSMLIYQAYNPETVPSMDYIEWRYTLSAAKLGMTFLVLPIILPIFYYLYYLIKIKHK